MPRQKPKTSKQIVVDRRAVMLGSVALAAPPLVGSVGAATTEPASEHDLQFTETEHIRQFYAKCRF